MTQLRHLPLRIKNCGLSTPEAIACAIDSGASFLGFVHHPASPRHQTCEQISALYAHVPSHVARVNVVVDPSDALLMQLPKPDFWQIHDVTDPARIRVIARVTGVPVITAIRMRDRIDSIACDALEAVSAYLLFDTYHPSDIGGTGQAFDWSLLNGMIRYKPWFLAGGLTTQNVARALHSTQAPMVDVSSGIEDAPGIKSLEKIAAFNKAVLDT